MNSFKIPFFVFLFLIALPLQAQQSGAQTGKLPHVLLVTIDTLRADHMSGYGYERNTSPYLDELMNDGVRFTQARTTIPLTCPALASMLTSLQPHEHGSTRNGLPIRERLPSLPKMMARGGYTSAAFVSNSVLRNHLCGLTEHFDVWEEVLNRRKFLFTWREAHADDVTEQGLEWANEHLDNSDKPFFLWVHYVEPHFPYNLQEDYVKQVGVSRGGSTFSPRNRYDTEIARVDASVGYLLEELGKKIDKENLLVVFTSDHGESLGNHGYWGHGKYVYDTGLHVPFSVTWPGKLDAGVIDAPLVISDLPSTLLSLLSLPVPESFKGYDFTPVMLGDVPQPLDRITYFQAHKSSVLASEKQRASEIRPEGLNEVGMVKDGRKEIFRVRKNSRRLFDLGDDTGEKVNLVATSSKPTEDLQAWLEEVQKGLMLAKDLAVPELDQKTKDELRDLGYIE